MEEEFFTLEEVSKYLKIPKSTLYKLSQQGKIPSCKIGKQLRFRKSSLDKWISQKENESRNTAIDSVFPAQDSHRRKKRPKTSFAY
ncbi:MAG: helix-turn-helix domain-containing protein [Candidatus Omnitrophica bacterium]|nr:helix-turn-helix domain-containing protein [Candidatus Omnitrophota bacterium]